MNLPFHFFGVTRVLKSFVRKLNFWPFKMALNMLMFDGYACVIAQNAQKLLGSAYVNKNYIYMFLPTIFYLAKIMEPILYISLWRLRINMRPKYILLLYTCPKFSK